MSRVWFGCRRAWIVMHCLRSLLLCCNFDFWNWHAASFCFMVVLRVCRFCLGCEYMFFLTATYQIYQLNSWKTRLVVCIWRRFCLWIWVCLIIYLLSLYSRLTTHFYSPNHQIMLGFILSSFFHAKSFWKLFDFMFHTSLWWNSQDQSCKYINCICSLKSWIRDLQSMRLALNFEFFVAKFQIYVYFLFYSSPYFPYQGTICK